MWHQFGPWPGICAATLWTDLPWQDTQHQVEHEEGADDDERDEVEPVPGVSRYIVGLHTHKEHRRKREEDEFQWKSLTLHTLGSLIFLKSPF